MKCNLNKPNSMRPISSTKTLYRGDVVWMELPQDLAPIRQQLQERKTRPFIVLNPTLTFNVDIHGNCIDNISMMGVDGTSKDYLVKGRPHLSFHLPHSQITTYAMLDSVRTVPCLNQKIRAVYKLKPDEVTELDAGLESVLKPEQRFYLRALFRRATLCMPGQIWEIETATRKGEAMVLLRRGNFPIIDNDGHVDCAQYQNEPVRQTPYLAAFFHNAVGVQSLRGIRWSELDIVALQERSFLRHTATMSMDTVQIMINNIRNKAGIAPITYQQLPILNLSWLPTLSRFRAQG